MGKKSLLTVLFTLLLATAVTAERIDLGNGVENIEVTVLESSDSRTVIQYQLGSFEQEEVRINGEAFYNISLTKESKMLNEGYPELPRICRSIIIPDEGRVSVNIISSDYIEFENMVVAPSKGNLLRTVNPEDVPYTFGSIYQSGEFYPSELTSIRTPYILRDYRATVVELNAFQYQPQKQTLRIYTSVTIEILYDGVGGQNVQTRSRENHAQIPEFERLYQRRFINYNYQETRYTSVPEYGDMLIITHDAFAAAMTPFVEWKKQKGIKTTIINVSAIGNTSTAIQGFVQAFYDSTNLTWLLLVGDGAQIATPYASGGSSDPSYAKLAGGDSYPEIFVGRFSAETEAHVETQVNRTITYELDPQGSGWFYKGTGVASDQGVGHYGEYDNEHMDNIRDDLLAYNYTLVDQIYDPSATSAQVASALNNGRSFVNYVGHGSVTAWSSSGFSNTNVNSLTNDNMLPFIISVACVNGQFNGSTCFGEAWLRATNGSAPTGAIGAYMSSINQSWSPPMYAQDEVTDLLIAEQKSTFGGLCFNSSCYMMDVGLSEGIPMYDTWHIFGDPSVQVRTATPGMITVNHEGALFFNAPEYQVEVVGVEGALCALYNNGTLYGSAYTGVDGIALISLSEELPFGGNISLTVTAYNKQTLVDNVVVTSDLAIIHTPLDDTKVTDTPYEVWSSIYTSAPLKADSLLLWYEINSTWNFNVLTNSGAPESFVGYIPQQTPGTVINYYIYAANDGGFTDSTEIYSFRVIDYAMLLDPVSAAESAPVNDTVWYDFIVTNDGVITDTYTLTSWGFLWDTSIWDETSSSEISSIGPIEKDLSAVFKLRVIVPPSANGESDMAYLQVKSNGNPLIFENASVQTYSAGQPLAIPFVDNFGTTDIDTTFWAIVDGPTCNGDAIAEPSEPYSINFDGDPNEGDLLVSRQINLRGLSGVNISYCYQQTGGGDSPESGDDLVVEYLNDNSEWTLLSQHLGSDPDMSSFETVTIGMPLDGYHALFQMRFSNTASSGPYDDWFIDNVRIDYGPAISINQTSYTAYLPADDSLTDILIIDNAGPGGLSYTLEVTPDFSRNSSFENLLQQGLVNPATISLPEGFDLPDEIKGTDNGYQGPVVRYNAGGPDNFGYFWMDSDEGSGPDFNWIDISTTGTEITGLTDDNVIGPLSLGIDFPFYNNTYNEIYIAANGFIGFGSNTGFTAYNNTAIPNSSTPNNAIYWCWDDLEADNSNNSNVHVYSQIVGNDYVLTFENYPEYSAAAGDVITAQIILSPSGDIKIQYNTVAAGFDVLSATVGIENETGDDALQVCFNTTYLHEQLAIQFTKPAQWLTCSSSSGNLLAGQQDTISLLISSVGLDEGDYKSNITIYSNDPDPWDNPLTIPVQMTCASGPPPYVCGDADQSGDVDISDAVYVIAFIFAGGPLPDPWESADPDCSGEIDVSDAVYLIAFIFSGGQAPCESCP